MCNGGAKRLLHQNMMGFGVAYNIHQDFIVSHVGSRYNHYITHSTIQQLLVTTKYLQNEPHRQHSIQSQITQSKQSHNKYTNPLFLAQKINNSHFITQLNRNENKMLRLIPYLNWPVKRLCKFESLLLGRQVRISNSNYRYIFILEVVKID